MGVQIASLSPQVGIARNDIHESMAMTLSEIGAIVRGDTEGDGDIPIQRLAKIEEAGEGDLTFLANPKYAKYLSSTKASAILVARNVEYKELRQRKRPIVLVRVDDPYAAFARLIDVFHPSTAALPSGIHPSAMVARSAVIGKDAAIGAHVVIGERCRIGHGAVLWHGVVVGDDGEVGDRSVIYPNVTLREQCKVGKRVIVHSGTVIGSDGFGFAPKADGTYEKIQQRGIVVIEDDVEIGANCAIDRATIGETRIKRGAKLDNLIQVAHNVVIGENTVIAAQTGISGSTKIGNGCIIAGQVGFVGHIEIADKTTVAAQSGVHKSVKEPGKTFFGYPALEHHERLRIEAALRQLPELITTVRALQKQLEELSQSLKRNAMNKET
jgi:UDP-3-O-[3-hydroxymyristoyl] glucosamine N-acyltransferase